MATPVRRIEKEFLFRALYEEKIPMVCNKDRIEYSFTLEKPAGKEDILLRPDRPATALKIKDKIDLLFNYRGQVIDFTVEILSKTDGLFLCNLPDVMYKNLDRNYLRIDAPSDIKIKFTFRGERYNLGFPKVLEYETPERSEVFKNLNSRNLSVLTKQIQVLLSQFADGYKIVNFKEKKPESIEEKIISEFGKTLFIPSTSSFLPLADPYPKKRIITEELFKRYLELNGTSHLLLSETCAKFIKSKHDEKIYSDAWVPILFHEYVIGYIHIWNTKRDRPAFEFSMLDSVHEFAKVLAFALKENGYFDYGKMENQPFEGRVLDISASGLLFAYPHSGLSTILLIDSELTVHISTPKRDIDVVARIVRRFKDRTTGYFGCRFMNMAPENMRYLFEYLYGRKIDDTDAMFLTGQV